MRRTEALVKSLKARDWGRSGSTILDVVPGSYPQIESVDGVGNLIHTGWISRGAPRGIDQKRLRIPLCTCGKRLDVPYVEAPDEARPFWSSVRREWVGRADPDGIESYPNFQNDFELKRLLPRLVYEKRRSSAAVGSYAGLTLAFFESIRAVRGKPVVVDCFKNRHERSLWGVMPGPDKRLGARACRRGARRLRCRARYGPDRQHHRGQDSPESNTAR